MLEVGQAYPGDVLGANPVPVIIHLARSTILRATHVVLQERVASVSRTLGGRVKLVGAHDNDPEGSRLMIVRKRTE